MLILLSFIIGLVYILINILQTSYRIADKKSISLFCYFLSASLWVGIVYLIIQNPLYNGVAYVTGSTIGMSIANSCDLTMIFNKKNE